MILLKLVIPLAIINAVILIMAMTFVIRAATESVDVIRDYSIVIQALMKEPAKRFNIKQQLEAYRTKNVIVTLAYISMLFLVIHSIVNMVTAARNPCGILLAIRLLCEHITSAIRVYFCLIGCLIYTAIIAVDLTVCMPTPTFPMIYQFTKGSKMLSLNKVNKSEILGGSYLPTSDTIEITDAEEKAKTKRATSRMIRHTPKRNKRSICDHCDLLRTTEEFNINNFYDICKVYNSIQETYNSEENVTAFEILDISEHRKLILSCDAGRTYISLGSLKPFNSEGFVIDMEIERTRRQAKEEPKDTDKKDEAPVDKEKYENIAFESKEKHYQRCQRMQDLLAPGLGLVFIALTCMTLILLMSRCERNPCICGYQKTRCVCEMRVCSCRSRGGGSPTASKIGRRKKLPKTPTTRASSGHRDVRTPKSERTNKTNMPQIVEAEIIHAPARRDRVVDKITTEKVHSAKKSERPKSLKEVVPEPPMNSPKHSVKGIFRKMHFTNPFHQKN